MEAPFKNGDAVKKGEIILVLETSKTTYDVAAEIDGYIHYDCFPGNDYEVNDIIARLFSSSAEAGAENKSAVEKKNTERISLSPVASWSGETVFSAAAEKMIRSSGIDAAQFKGMDFVSRADVEAQLSGTRELVVAVVDIPAPIVKSLQADPESVIVEKLTSGKRKEINYLREVQSGSLISTINTVVETEGIFTHLNRSLKYLQDSLLPLVLYEGSRLLHKFPLLNAYYTGDGIAQYKRVDIGFAVDMDKGLKVLRVPDTASKTMQEIEQNIMDLSNRYLDESLQVTDVTGVSFTVTDLSSQGVQFFTPLVNMLNSAILGLSAIDQKLDRCILSLTFDHRVTEGKYVSVFLAALKGRMESYRAKNHSYPLAEINCYKCYKRLEEDLSGVGFMKCITPQGKEGYICQNCINGF